MKDVIVIIILAVALAAILAFALSFADTKLAVDEDPRIKEVADMLPNANCGACGNPGCRGMAESLLAGDSKLTQCKPGTQEMREQIAEYISTHPNEEGEYTKVKW
jgi:electron transport complex protein RnfB